MAVPSSRPKLKTAFKKARTIAPLYTSGPVAVTSDGSKIVTCVGEDILFTEVETGIEICRFIGDTQTVTALCITPSSSHLILFTASMSLRIYELPNAPSSPKKHIQPLRTVARAHDAPVHVCKVDPTSSYFASGAADGVVKVWDILRGYVTHVFKGHGGVVSALAFSYPVHGASVTQERTMRLFTASVDTRIRIFNLTLKTSTAGGSKPEVVLEGHVSVPRGLDVSSDGRWLLSGGRDSVVIIWDLLSSNHSSNSRSIKGKGKDSALNPVIMKTIPVLERVEALGILSLDAPSSSDMTFYTGGQKGVIRIWDGKRGEVLHTLGKEHGGLNDNDEEQRQILDVLYLPSSSIIASVQADQNILFYSLSSQALVRQLIGYNDEIVDAVFLGSQTTGSSLVRDSQLALATNSSFIRVYSTKTTDARLLEGHSEIVLSLDRSADGRFLVSGSKDRSARLWASWMDGTDWGYKCVGICEGHTESVGAIAMSRTASGENQPALRFMFTGSQDRTIKMWDVSDVADAGNVVRCHSLTTHKAHDKDINSLDVSPNDRLLVSGSQDRTAKIYEIEYHLQSGKPRGELKLVGTCKGHKRGVWSVRFGKTERLLVTGSGDKTVKLWSLDDFSCLKTFEGHTNSVLRVDFFNAGMQLISSASDGLVKIWNIKEEECVNTLDNHEDKVWALAISSNECTIVSGAADSIVTFWEDCTEEEEANREAKRAQVVLQDQDFQNYVSLKDYRRAIQLALAMEQPGRLLSLFKAVAGFRTMDASDSALTGDRSVDEVIKTLHPQDLSKLLRYVRDWNTNGKTSPIAQGILFAIMKLRPAEDVIGSFIHQSPSEDGISLETESPSKSIALRDMLDALIPYTERHLSRMEKLIQESYVVDYILGEMDDGIYGGDTDEDAMKVDQSL